MEEHTSVMSCKPLYYMKLKVTHCVLMELEVVPKVMVVFTSMRRTVIWGKAFRARPLILTSFVGREKIFKDCAREGAEQLSTLTSGNWRAAEKKTGDHKETKNLRKREPQAPVTLRQKMTSSSQAKATSG